MHHELPPLFVTRMQQQLGSEYAAFAATFGQPRTFGLRLLTDRIRRDDFEALVPFEVSGLPWIDYGYSYSEEIKPSHCPLYQAGLYYLQDPGAMTPASRLPVEPGDRVLDLCAAPGGKAVAAADSLKGHGLLVANDISQSRAKILLRNLEQCGTVNSIITNESPRRLAERFPAFFDKIILDAPCSGEGMFRKEEALLLDWSEEKSRQLAKTQRELLALAVSMLRPGGLLMYSTCTYATEEDEEAIRWILEREPELRIRSVQDYEGFAPGSLEGCVRIYPHRMAAEGHFMALLEKARSDVKGRSMKTRVSKGSGKADRSSLALVKDFFESLGICTIGGNETDWSRMEIRGDKVYYLPEECPILDGLAFLRAGLLVGEKLKGRFEPSHQLALALHRKDLSGSFSMAVTDERLISYLRGEAVSVLPSDFIRSDESPGRPHPLDPVEAVKGWQILSVEGYPLAFCKVSGQTAKNKIPKSWRIPASF